MEDTLRPEYDLTSLRVRRVGPERKRFNGLLVSLEPDVAAAFPNTAAVNAALRTLLQKSAEAQETVLPQRS